VTTVAERVEVPTAELEALLEAADNLQMAVGAAAFRATTKGILIRAYEKYLFARVAWAKAVPVDESVETHNMRQARLMAEKYDRLRELHIDGGGA
jgi:hypothetical protein